MPSRASTSFLLDGSIGPTDVSKLVSMPSRASTSFLLVKIEELDWTYIVSMPSRASTSFLRLYKAIVLPSWEKACQCPHGLVPHFYVEILNGELALSSHDVSMPSRASTSFLPLAKLEYSNAKHHCVNALTG